MLKPGQLASIAAAGRPWTIIGPLCVAAAGCMHRSNEMRVVSLHEPSSPRRFFTRFEASRFRQDHTGHVDVLMRSEHEGDGGSGDRITEVVEIHAFWKPIPGTTLAESSMTNARIRYTILTPGTAIQYEGAGFASFELTRDRSTLFGRLEAAQLSTIRRQGPARDLFGPSFVHGSFSARRDDRAVLRGMNELDRRLGGPDAMTNLAMPDR